MVVVPKEVRLVFDFLKKIFSTEGGQKDPVCGMGVDPKKTSHHVVFAQKDYYFCSSSCQGQFEGNPQSFIDHQ